MVEPPATDEESDSFVKIKKASLSFLPLASSAFLSLSPPLLTKVRVRVEVVVRRRVIILALLAPALGRRGPAVGGGRGSIGRGGPGGGRLVRRHCFQRAKTAKRKRGLLLLLLCCSTRPAPSEGAGAYGSKGPGASCGRREHALDTRPWKKGETLIETQGMCFSLFVFFVFGVRRLDFFSGSAESKKTKKEENVDRRRCRCSSRGLGEPQGCFFFRCCCICCLVVLPASSSTGSAQRRVHRSASERLRHAQGQ